MNRVIKIAGVFCVVWVVTLLFTSHQTSAQSIKFPDFSDVSLLTLNGDTQQAGAILRLTPDLASQAGTAFLSSPVTINQETSFHTEFKFQMSGQNDRAMRSDGLAFVIHNDSRKATALGHSGASLGFGIDKGWSYPSEPEPKWREISPSVAIEFDTYQNTFDTNDHHVGVIFDGDVQTHYASGTPSFAFDANDNPLVSVWIDYDGGSESLKVYVSQNNSKPTDPVLDMTINLVDRLDNEVFFGFTAATGGGFNIHDILSWNLGLVCPTCNVSVNLDPTGKTQIPGINPYEMTGAGIDGMVVITEFSDGFAEARLWEDIDPYSGGVFGTCWSLTESGDTFGGIWTLTRDYTYQNRELTRIWIDALTGGSVFDTGSGGGLGIEYDISRISEFGTDGSALGWTFDVQSAPCNLDIEVTYSDMVALSGQPPQPPVGDIYRYLEIDFTNPGGFAAGDTLTFIADTDKVVPEPSTLLLLGAGLIGVLAFRRRGLRRE